MRKLSKDGSAPVHLRPPPEELAQIDRAAELRQATRSEIIREAIQRGREQLAIEQLADEVDRT